MPSSSSSSSSHDGNTPKRRQSSVVTNMTELSIDLREIPRRPAVRGGGIDRIGGGPTLKETRTVHPEPRPLVTQVVKAKPTEDRLEETHGRRPGDISAEYVDPKAEEPHVDPKKRHKIRPFPRIHFTPRSIAKVADTVFSQGFASPARTPISRTRSLSVLESVACKPEETPNVDLDRRSAHPKPSEHPPEHPLELVSDEQPESPPDELPDQPLEKPVEDKVPFLKSKEPHKPRYKFVVRLGFGAHGEVWLCQDPMGVQYAVKTLKPAKLYDRHKKSRYALEKKVLHICRDDPDCPESIVKFYETFYHKGWPFGDEHSPRLCHAMEYCRGQTLYHRLCGKKSPDGKVYYDKKILDGEVARSICEQILKGLSFLHKKKIVHSDMKPENIMFTSKDESDFTVKIIDFGLSLELKEDRDISREIGGTPMYHPPEIFLGQRLVSFKMDMWAFGITLWEMVHGINKFPICPIRYETALERAKRDKEKARKLLWEHNIRESHKPLRFTTNEWRSMPDAIPLAEGLLRKDCASRISAEEALQFVEKPWETKIVIRSRL